MIRLPTPLADRPVFQRRTRKAMAGALGLLFCLSWGASALVGVSPREARTAAMHWVAFYCSHNLTWNGAANPELLDAQPLRGPQGRVVAYFFPVRPSGYVLTPAFRELPPIKAFSTRDTLRLDPPAPSLQAMVRKMAAVRDSLIKAERGRGGLDARANQQAWETFLKTRRDAYFGLPGVTIERRQPLLDNLDRWDPDRQPASQRTLYNGRISWHGHYPLTRFLPRVRTTPEELWIDRDDSGWFKNGKDADLVAYDADGTVTTETYTPGSSNGVYFYDWDGIGTYRLFVLDPKTAAADPVHYTTTWGKGYDVWKDEAGGTPGVYDAAWDTRIFDGGDGWQTPDGAVGSHGEITSDPAHPKGRLFYSDLDGSGDYTNWYGYPLPGAAAVTLGEIMRFWEWPDVGRGSHSYQWAYREKGEDADQTVTLTADFEHPYLWDRMPLWGLHAGTATDDEIDNVARLIADIGICFNTDFQLSLPRMTFSQENLGRFAYHFKYNPNAIRFIRRMDYSSDQEWFSKLQAELQAHRPVLLTAYKDKDTLISSVVDGYDRLAGAANLFLLHCNFSWDGVHDYWYALDNIDGMPGGGDEPAEMVQLQEAVVNILPERVPRVVVAELFHAVGAPREQAVADALKNLEQRYGRERLAILAWDSNTADPLYPSDPPTRDFLAAHVQNLGLDAAALAAGAKVAAVWQAVPEDAYLTQTGDGDDPESALRSLYQRSAAVKAAFRIAGDAVFGDSAAGSPDGLPYLKADVYVTALDENSQVWDNLRLRAFLVEDDVDANGTAYSWVVRRLLLDQDLELGSGVTRVVNIGPLHPAEVADMTHAAVIVEVTDRSSGHVLQAGWLTRHLYGDPFLGNAPPKAPVQVRLTPVMGQGGCVALHAEPVGAGDPDGDRLTYVVRWYKNGTLLAVNGKTENDGLFDLDAADAGGFNPGDRFFCDVRVRDAWYYAVDARLRENISGKMNTPPYTYAEPLSQEIKQTNPYLGSVLTDLRDSHETTSVSSSLVVIIGDAPPGNHAPTAPASVWITPAGPASTTDIACLAAGSTDPDGDSFSYVFQWAKSTDGGVAFTDVPGQTAQILPATATSAGELWECKVAARDRWGVQSAWTVSDPVTVRAPDAAAPSRPLHASITPRAPSYIAALTCTKPTGITASGAYEVHYRWWRRNGPAWELTTRTGAELPVAQTNAGDEWRCEVFAVDVASGAQGPSLFTDPVFVRNFAPSAPIVSVYPPVAGTDKDLEAVAHGSSDPEDGLNITYHYQWFVNGAPAGITDAVVPAAVTASGEHWYCRIYAEDSLGARSPVVDSPEILVGTRPTAPTEVILQPSAPPEDADLTCVAGGSTDADGDNLTYLFSWYRNGELQTSLTASVVPSTLTSYGEHWQCVVRAYDGMLLSPPVWSNIVRIGGNEPPSAPEIALDPAKPHPGQAVQCVIETASEDPEGETVTYYYTWYRNHAITSHTGATLPTGVTAAGEVWQCFVYAQDPEGARSTTVVSPEISLVNDPPSAPAEVTVSPAVAKSDVPLVCTASGSVDPNGETVSYVYVWYKYASDPANPIKSTVTAAELPASETRDGDHWFCEVRAVDPEGAESSPVRSNVALIGNVAPHPPAVVSIAPNPAGTGADLVCTASGAADPNGDPVTYHYQWLKNGTVQPNFTDYRLPAANLVIGDVWTCRVSAFDGELESSSVDAAPVTIVNLPPSAPASVVLTPRSPTEINDLTCSAYGASDPEGGPVHFIYRWYRNGELTTYSAATLPAAATAVGEHWSCAVSAVDDAGRTSESVSSSAVTILSAAPSAPSVAVTPAAPSVSDPLTCTAQGSVDPTGGNVVYEYRWYRNGQDSGITASTVNPASTHTGEVWKCVVTPTNAAGFKGPTVTSNEVYINNRAPSDPSVLVQPAAARPGVALECVASGSVDPDGHPVSYAYVWVKDGADTAYHAAELPAGITQNGETWQCRVTAADPYGGESNPVLSNAVHIGNLPPSAPTVSVSPAIPVLGGMLTCTASGAVDPNGDKVTYLYRWQNDGGAGVWVDSGNTSPAIGPLANDGWSWRCIVQATDGDAASAPVVSNVVTVAGHAPTAPDSVVVTPANPGVSDDLVCTASGAGDADGDALVYHFLWYRNGTPAGFTGTIAAGAGAWTSTLAAAYTGHGETWKCRVWVTDQRGAESEAGFSNAVTVLNPFPDPPDAVQLLPAEPTINNSLHCTVTGPDKDAAGHALDYVPVWLKNGVAQPEYTELELPASATGLGERWACEVRTRNAAGALSNPVRSNEVVIGAAGNDAFENDNERTLATELLPGAFQGHGIEAADPADWVWFRIDGLSEVSLRIERLSGSAEFQMDLFRKDESTPFAVRRGAAPCVDGIFPPGVYQARVRDASAVRDVSYYGIRLEVSPAVSLGTDAMAPVDFTLTETRPNRWFYFTVPAATAVTVTPGLVAGSAELAVRVVNPNGETVAQTETPPLSASLAAGTYYLEISGTALSGRGTNDVYATVALAAQAAIPRNHPPNPPAFARIFPQHPCAGDRLIAVANGAWDPDWKKAVDAGRDPDPKQTVQLAYRWVRNGTLIPGLTGPAVPPAYVSDGDSWTCLVTARDGYGAAAAAVQTPAAAIGQRPNWTVPIQVFGGALNALLIGQNNAATNGYDADFDDGAPPAGPDAAQVAILGPSDHPYLDKDIRAAGGDLVYWYVAVNPRTGVALHWDASGLPEGAALTLTEVDANGDPVAGTQVDMREVSGLDLGTGGAATLRIAYSPGLLEYETVALERGWNLVSFWLSGDYDAASLVFQGVVSGSVWRFDAAAGVYHAALTIAPKTGYWVYAPVATVIQHIGYPVRDGLAALAAGWNLVGPLRDIPAPGGSDILSVFGWQAGQYTKPTLLQRGHGYWILSRRAQQINLK